jgi:hypothetical protein
MRCLHRRVKGEEGVAMIVAIGALTVISILVALVANGATTLSNGSERDRHSKRAIAAAEGGLRQAMFKLNNLAPGDGSCVGTWDAALNSCKSEGQTLGNGTTYSYYMTKIPYTATCAGLPPEGDPNVAIRCITVEATAAGVSRRIQARVGRYLGTPLLPLPGIFAKDGISFINDTIINGSVGSNANIHWSNNLYARDGMILGPSGTTTGDQSKFTAGVTPKISTRTAAEGAFAIAPLDYGSTPTTNDNGAWVGSGATYNAGARTLDLGTGTFTFNGGTYNLCRLTTAGATTFVVPAGKKVLLLIDDPARPGSGCGAGTGYFRSENATTLSNPNGADAFQVHAYGADPSSSEPVIWFKSNVGSGCGGGSPSPWKGIFHAWQGTVFFQNDACLEGGVAAAKVTALNKLTFSYPPGMDVRAHTSPVYSTTYWKECRAQRATSSDPRSGC